jgi:hypothetical protein
MTPAIYAIIRYFEEVQGRCRGGGEEEEYN